MFRENMILDIITNYEYENIAFFDNVLKRACSIIYFVLQIKPNV